MTTQIQLTVITKLREFIRSGIEATHNTIKFSNDPYGQEAAILDTYDLITGQIDRIEKEIAALNKPVEHENPVIKVCDICGMPNIRIDAWAEWTVPSQKWELADVYEHVWCMDCESSCNAKDVPLAKGFAGKI